MEDAWADFIKVHKDAKLFKNKGWVHLEKVTSLMPATVKGTHVFRPSQGMSGMDPFDEDDDDLPPNVLTTQEGSTVADDDIAPPQVVASAPVSCLSFSEIDSYHLCVQVNPSTPTRVSRKREHAASETPARTTKKAKMSTADAMMGLNSAILQFGDSMCKALAGDSLEKTPHRHTKAMKLAQKENWLEMDDRLILCNVLERDIKAADAYLALDTDDVEFRQMWMDRKVAEVKALGASA